MIAGPEQGALPRGDTFRTAQKVTGFDGPAVWLTPKSAPADQATSCSSAGCTSGATVVNPAGQLVVRTPTYDVMVSMVGTRDDLAATTTVARLVIARRGSP